jgi:endonuclease YncB( thermonuclease family)
LTTWSSAVFAQQQYADNLVWGKVIRILDGDTIEIKNDQGQSIRVQLAYIDAPDMDPKTGEAQPLHQESMNALGKIIRNKEVIIESLGVDRFKRIKGIVFLDKINVNLVMVRKGMAEIYNPVRVSPKAYNQRYVTAFLDAEKLARSNKTGVWGINNYSSPYKFRRRK